MTKIRTRSVVAMLAASLALTAGTSIVLHHGAVPAAAQPSAEAGPPDFTPAGRWSLQERQYWQRLQQELDRRTTALSERCGARITATYVHESFRERMTDGGSFGLDAYTRATCDAPLDAMFTMCTNSELAKQAIQQTVRHVECEWGQTRYSLGDGTIRFRFDTAERNAAAYRDHVKSWIEQSL
jgi:hypothetical protein